MSTIKPPSLMPMLISVLLIGCAWTTTQADQPGRGLAADLIGDWTSSYEENEADSEQHHYRRTDSRRFPPSRFRMRYVFNDNHTCQWLVLDPTDRHHMASGTWALDEDDPTMVLIYDLEGEPVRRVSFRVNEINTDLLVITPLDR